MVIFIEGSDYSGKSTLIKSLEKYISSKGLKVKTLREPDGEYRDKLLGPENLSFMVRRSLFQTNHLDLLEKVYNLKNKFDYILIDRCAAVSDYVYSRIESNIDSYAISSSILEVYKVVDDKLYNNYFKNNSILINLEISAKEFMKRVLARTVKEDDNLDKKGFAFKEAIFFGYSSLNTELEIVNTHLINSLFFKTYILKDGDFLNKVKNILGV